jgi:hypothetical protein
MIDDNWEERNSRCMSNHKSIANNERYDAIQL